MASTRLCCHWDSPGKITGVGCHFLLHQVSNFLSIGNSIMIKATSPPSRVTNFLPFFFFFFWLLLFCLVLVLVKASWPSGLPRWLSGKESTCNEGDSGLIPEFRRSPGEGNGYLLQYSCLESHGKSHGQRSLVGFSPWGCKEWNTNEHLSTGQLAFLSHAFKGHLIWVHMRI